MKTIQLTVAITATVPDDANTASVYLHMDYGEFRLGHVPQGSPQHKAQPLEGAEVTEFTTLNVAEEED